jgi:hypothetical protein
VRRGELIVGQVSTVKLLTFSPKDTTKRHSSGQRRKRWVGLEDSMGEMRIACSILFGKSEDHLEI